MPRRQAYEESAGGDAEWCKDVGSMRLRPATARPTEPRAPPMSSHDQYAWSFNEYAKRQGFGSFLVRCGEGERAPRSSGTGRLKPTYDDKGALRVAPAQLVLAWLLDLGSGSLETPKGGHADDEPFLQGAAAPVSSCRVSRAHLARGWRSGAARVGLLVL